ncbi:MAG: signal peptidase I [Leptolinea sp.]
MNIQQNPSDYPTASDLIITEPVDVPESRRSQIFAIIREIIQTLLLAIVLYFMIDFVVARVRVENVSMKPTLLPGEFLLVNKLTYKFSGMSRGDIVVFHYPPQPSEDYIKRLIGLPGDTVEINNGKILVNKQPLTEPYIMANPTYKGEWQVPSGSIFVLGDNRNSSSDSHIWGFVPIENIMGKAIVIYWPLQNAHLITHPNIVNAAAQAAP